jgi:leader peptidase (prepilin peptidase)/N-methyltransferase
MLNLLFALVGLLLGGVINSLADYLPASERPLRPHCPRCRHVYEPAGWLALIRQLQRGGRCSQCELPPRRRPLLVEVGMALLFAMLPSLIPNLATLIVNSFHIAVLVLIIVIDLENRLIFDVVTYPATVLAVVGSLVVTRAENTLPLALVGAVAGYVFFYILYWLAQLIYGSGSGALGGGDVKLAMAMGAMLGFHRIFFALFLGIALGGVVTLLLLLSRRVNRYTHLPYGQYLALAGIIMLIWGTQVAEQYIN